MTLTSLLPTLRESIPSPFRSGLWPVGAVASTHDVTITGVSLLRFVELCATPCVTTGPAVIPLSGGIPSSTEWTSAVVVSVVAATDDGVRTLTIDASLAAVPHDGGELRMIGRISHAPDRVWVVRDANGDRVALDAPTLPADLRPGDLLALPCRGAVALGDIRPGSSGR
ncbi:hypothetical protein J2Y69_002045 [Microbacterium resistens]|uniref:Uncharacterized protein n=1 Tax=Microbacterium resistens TaxID=156977 RepID=A0ABU1SEY6_9MICO|nr:hypothetical protein [Microbacterium resistens]MDR6867442.1 hypothetical protein [Microbacterium resistens]